MRVLLAGPGTGKTTKIRTLLSEMTDPTKVLIISFTNATVNDLIGSLGKNGVTSNNCMTLHKFAVKYNHDKTRHVLNSVEETKLRYICAGTGIGFDQMCDFLTCTTFDQMIERFVSFAKANEAYLTEKITDFEILIVDEYQDFNDTEQGLIDVLTKSIPDTIILGDDDQCIYDFKDASAKRIIQLHNDNEHIAHEHICRRCPDIVVDHASRLISNNKNRVTKDWHKSGIEGNLLYRQMSGLADVAEYVTHEIQSILSKSETDTIFILAPVKFVADDIITSLNTAEILFNNEFSTPIESDLIIAAWKLRYLFGDHAYFNLLMLGYLLIEPRKPLYELLQKHIAEGKNLTELRDCVARKFPPELVSDYQNIEEALLTPAFERLYELFTIAEGDTVNEKLENLLRKSEETTPERVRLMTIHKSKGLGADHVFIVGMTEGILPNKTEGEDSVESQRRRFYVAMTRAKKTLHILCAVKLPGKYARRVSFDDFKFNRRDRMYDGQASRFVTELQL